MFSTDVKKIFLILFAIFPLVSFFLVHDAFGDITGSPHDFRGILGEDPLQRICIFCHVPHNSFKSGTYYPLWSREVVEKNYTVYGHGNGPTSGNHALNSQQTFLPDRQSLLCLSCHDGTFAIDATPIGGEQNLSNHHPVSFNYDEVAATDLEIAPSSTQVNMTTTIKDLLLYGTIMTCSTCHEAHNAFSEGSSFLYKNNSGSKFCLICHLK